MIGIFLDWLLGPRCRVCDQRVFPRDLRTHHGRVHGIVWTQP